MKKFLIYMWTTLEVVLKWVISFGAAALCVLTPIGIPIAVGFMAVTASHMVSDPYLKVIVAAGGSIAALWLVFNVAEVAILLTAYRIKMLIDRYVLHLERVIDDDNGVTPLMVTQFT